ncbi:MAG: S41 family peptidase [Planctomycetota bacterium]
MRAVCVALTCALVAGPLGGQELTNPGFEEGAQGEAPEGWTATHGAGAANGKPSVVTRDTDVAWEGESSLRLSGDDETWSWQYVAQRLEAKPAQRWAVRLAVRSDEVHQGHEQQFYNSYVAVSFYDAEDKLLKRERTPMITGTRDWSKLVLQGVAPEKTVHGEVAFFLSMTGTLWLDGIELDVTPTLPFDKQARGAAFDALEGHLRRTYPFFGLSDKPAADELFGKYRSKAVKKKDVEGFAEVLVEMLDPLDDLHVYLDVAGERLSTGPKGNPNPTNWNMEVIDERVDEVISKGANHLVARLNENQGYVRLGSFGAEWEEIKRIDVAMDQLADAHGWVIDVRPNGGGGEDKAQYIAARFVRERIEYARSKYRDSFAPDDETAFTEAYPRWLEPREGRQRDGRPVAVLMGPFCVSSTEGFLLMMKAVPTATLVGKPSRGASANPGRFTIVPGLDIVSSRWRSLTLEDECIEGVGVQPDVLVDERLSKYRKRDPTFEKALEILIGG